MTPDAPGLSHEFELGEQGCALVAGLDEAGRGALAGPVVAAAVILPLDHPDLTGTLAGVRDSKQCTPRQRDRLFDRICAVALAWGVGSVDAAEIDRLGIAPATRLAMRRAIESLALQPDALLIDWVKLNAVNLPQRSLVRGECHSLSIAAASIIAKVSRDRLMIAHDPDFPDYGFARHKGYGTADHRAAIALYGPTPLHRRTFAPLRPSLIDPEPLDEARAGA